MTRKNTKLYANKRLQYKMNKENMRIQELESENKILQDEITELKTSDFNYIFHMDKQKRVALE